jgi:hypothetical protein
MASIRNACTAAGVVLAATALVLTVSGAIPTAPHSDPDRVSRGGDVATTPVESRPRQTDEATVQAAGSFNKTYATKSGALIAGDFDFEERARRELD